MRFEFNASFDKSVKRFHGEEKEGIKNIAIQNLNIFYIMPQSVFSSYRSEISLVETTKRQRKPKSAKYRENWDLLF